MADLVRVIYLAVTRPEEACLIRPCDVNREGLAPNGVKYPGLWVYIPDSHKTEHHDVERVIFLNEEAQAVLAKYLDRPTEAYCFSPKESAEEWLRRHGRSTSRGRKRDPGEFYPPNSVGQAVRKAVDRYNRRQLAVGPCPPDRLLPRWCLLQLRHSGATFLRAAHDLKSSKAVMSHQRLDTSQIYAERDLDRAAVAVRSLRLGASGISGLPASLAGSASG